MMRGSVKGGSSGVQGAMNARPAEGMAVAEAGAIVAAASSHGGRRDADAGARPEEVEKQSDRPFLWRVTGADRCLASLLPEKQE
jgi:hypothetical protein